MTKSFKKTTIQRNPPNQRYKTENKYKMSYSGRYSTHLKEEDSIFSPWTG